LNGLDRGGTNCDGEAKNLRNMNDASTPDGGEEISDPRTKRRNEHFRLKQSQVAATLTVLTSPNHNQNQNENENQNQNQNQIRVSGGSRRSFSEDILTN
jgi:hypothetical protein